LPTESNLRYNIGILNDKGVCEMNKTINVNEILDVNAINTAIEAAYNSGVMTTESGITLWDGLAAMVYNNRAPSGGYMNELGETTYYDNYDEINIAVSKLYPLVNDLVESFRGNVE